MSRSWRVQLQTLRQLAQAALYDGCWLATGVLLTVWVGWAGATATAGAAVSDTGWAHREPAGDRSSAWQAMPAIAQSRLLPLQDLWSELTPGQRAKWRSIADSMDKLSADEQIRVQDRMREWSTLSAGDRAQARLNFQELRTIPKSARSGLWEAYRQLPASERDRLQAQPSVTAPPSQTQQQGSRAATQPKRNTLPPVPKTLPPKAVSPVVVQAKPGATTRIMSEPGLRPWHHQAGLPKIVATEEFVDPLTLLPRRGPQAAEQWRLSPTP